MKKESRGASRGKKTEYDALPYDFDTEEYYEEEEVADELFEEEEDGWFDELGNFTSYVDGAVFDPDGNFLGYEDELFRNDPAEEKKNRRRAIRRSLPLYAALAVLTVFAWMLPIRPAYSEKEGRELASFPAFSSSALFSGAWFEDISTWFSDTFPGRDGWVTAQSGLSSHYGDRSSTVSGGLALTFSDVLVESAEEELEDYENFEELDPLDDPLAPEELDTPEETVLPPEADPSEALPETTPEPTPVPTNDPTGGDSVEEGEIVRKKGALLTIGDTAYELYGLGKGSAKKYGTYLSKAADKLVGRARLFSIIAPNSGGIMLSYDTYDEYYNIRQDEAIDAFYEGTSENLIPVRVYDTLRAHNNEYLYFRTDHHWTGLGAYYAYEEWCRAAGFEPVPLSEYDEFVLDDFVGWFYKKENNPTLAANPDTVIAYKPHANMSASISDKGTSFKPIELIADYRDSDASTKYLTFLQGGEYHYIKIINEDVQDDSACLILKDSYGNPFSIFAAQHYHTVIVASIRFYNNVELLLRKYNFDDIILCTELVLAQQDDMLANIKKSFANIQLPK